MHRFLSPACLVLLFAVLAVSSASIAQERQCGVNRSIDKISERVYHFGSDIQYGAYIVGSEAIAAVYGHYCPCGTMQWLKTQLAQRHNVPVKYVILSHDRPDHICNTQVFEDTAIAIGHANILPHIDRERRQSMVPSITFDHSMEILLGGVTVKLLYFGPSHSDNLIRVHVPDEKVMIAVDMAKGRSLFPDYRDMDVHSILRVFKILGNLGDVDLVLPGHGPVADQQTTKRSAPLYSGAA